MIPYIFVAATAINVLPILLLFKILIEKIKENPNQANKFQMNFLIGAALCESIPILIIIYGFSNLTTMNSIQDLYMPGIIILLITAFANFFIFLQRMVDIDDEIKGVVSQFVIIGIALINAI